MRRRDFATFAFLASCTVALPAAAEFDRRVARRGFAALLADNRSPVSAAPGPVTLVEFFDYQCPSCRACEPHLRAALAAAPEVRLVYKEFPNLGATSLVAARAALAARGQDAYEALHRALYDRPGRLTQPLVFEAAAALGLSVDRLRTDMESADVSREIADTARLARRLGIEATPIFLIGNGGNGETADALAGGLARDQFLALFRQFGNGA